MWLFVYKWLFYLDISVHTKSVYTFNFPCGLFWQCFAKMLGQNSRKRHCVPMPSGLSLTAVIKCKLKRGSVPQLHRGSAVNCSSPATHTFFFIQNDKWLSWFSSLKKSVQNRNNTNNILQWLTDHTVNNENGFLMTTYCYDGGVSSFILLFHFIFAMPLQIDWPQEAISS